MADLATYAYRFPHNSQPTLDEDVPGEFYLYCHEKLAVMIDRFEDRGVPFEHYLNSVLRWQLRSFLRHRKRQERIWRSRLFCQNWSGTAEALADQQREFDPVRILTPRSPLRYTGARAPALRLADPPRATPSRKPRFRMPQQPGQRHMLILLLKTIHVLDERQFATLAAASGCHPDSLTRVLRRLARHMEPNRNRLAMLRERRNQAFVLCQLWAATAFVETDPQKLARAQQNLERYRTTLVRSREELARVRTAPSNRMIADVLGLSKGTVETGLRTLRERIPTRYRPRDGVGSGQQQSP